MAFKTFVCASASVLALTLGTAAQAQDATTAPSGDENVPEAIVVSGVRASLSGAVNVRKQSTQIIDSIVAEDVGKLPDNNVIEALQRVTGIQVTDRASGEAGNVTIRGLADPLTTLNGRNIFTAAGQSFALQDVSANLIKQVDVYKTRSADQIETGLAGQIDIKTRRPFDFKGFTISGLARGIYDEQANSYNPNVALLVSDRWETGIGDVGILVNASWSRAKYRTMSATAGALVPFATETPPAGSGLSKLERIFPGPDNVNWTPGLNAGLATAPGSTLNINGVATPYYLARDAVFSSDLYGKRERPSANIALQWSPNSSSTYTAEAFYAGFRGNTFNSLMFSFVDWWGNPGPVTLYDGTNIIKTRTNDNVYGFNSADFSTNKTDSFVYALNGKWDIGERGGIVADVAYQTSTNENSFIAMRTDRVAQQITADFNAGGGVASYHFNDDSLLTDPSQWNIAQLYDNAGKAKGNALTFTIDGHYEWDSGFLRGIKAGFRYDDRKASTFTRTGSANNLNRNLSTLPAESLFTNSNFFDGRASVPTSWVLPSGYWLNENADTVRGLYGLPTSDQLSLDRVFDIGERTMAAYIQANGELNLFGRPLRLEAGVRFVSVDTDTTFLATFGADKGLPKPGSVGSERFLPSFTARYDVTDKLRLRFNYGETLRRPAFADLNPNPTLTGDLTNLGYGSGAAGNSALKPTHSKNYDLALEWYFDRDSAIYVTGFRREIEGLVVPLSAMEYIPNNGITAGATNYFVINRPVNASNGVLKGLEVGLTWFPRFLPSPLNGLGFTGSATVLDSNQNIPEQAADGTITQTQSQFFNVSKFSYNATLAYDKGPVSARLSYIWRQAFLHNNEARLFANPIGVWFRPEKSLDFQLTLNVTDRVGITFDAVNLTSEMQQNYYKYGSAGNQDQFNLGSTLRPRTFALGARFKFD